MGKYINVTEKGTLGATFFQKIGGLENDGAVAIPTPTKWEEGLVCIVNNGAFAAAGYAYNKAEMQAFLTGIDGRPCLWMKYEKAKKYAG